MTIQESTVELDVITAVLKDLPEAERVKFYYMLLGARAVEGHAVADAS